LLSSLISLHIGHEFDPHGFVSGTNIVIIVPMDYKIF
jgi:hypothetical protein